jgi:hypothetical protein
VRGRQRDRPSARRRGRGTGPGSGPRATAAGYSWQFRFKGAPASTRGSYGSGRHGGLRMPGACSRHRTGAYEHMFRREFEMAETTTKRSPAHQRGVTATRATAVVDRTTVLSDQVLKSLEAGRAAIEALRKLVDTVDGTLPITATGRPGGRRSSTPRWRWPTCWSIRSTISSARSSTALRRRWAAATGKARVGHRARMSGQPPERVPRWPRSWLRVEGTRNTAHGAPRG